MVVILVMRRIANHLQAGPRIVKEICLEEVQCKVLRMFQGTRQRVAG
jgi:hypothetical protein